jgi:hypothetical protein
MKMKAAQIVVVVLLLVIILGFVFLSYNRRETFLVKKEGFYANGPSDVPALPKAESVASLSKPNVDVAGAGIGNYAASISPRATPSFIFKYRKDIVFNELSIAHSSI